MKQIQISIIVVHYKADREFFACVQSLINYPPNVPYQFIVIDNDEKSIIKEKLISLFPTVMYVTNPKNTGFGAGNNIGAKIAKGKYLFFLNPDTLLHPNSIDALFNYLDKNSQSIAVSPILLDKNENPYPLQGAKILTPYNGVVVLSFLNKIFPHNSISNYYWLKNSNKNSVREVEVLPGTAFMIRKNIFDDIGGFDEKFFLYFEEFDLCKRLYDKQYKMYSIPESQVTHFWGKSTEERNDIKLIFIQSRKYYFSKHFGWFGELIVEIFANFNKEYLLLLLILSLGFFLLFFKLNILMQFIGDQAWFYISARNMLLYHTIPYVGITSSHTWLHQGPLWTYFIAVIFLLTNFNPLAPGYIGALVSCLSIYMIYKLGSSMISQKTGIIAAFLFATSPLVILNARMPFCTLPIPLFVSLFIFSLYKFVNHNKLAFPLCIFLLAILYNLEIATFIFIIIFLFIVTYGLITKAVWTKDLVNSKIISFSLLGLTPMIPMIIYDTSHGYPQTIKFAGWFILHVISIIIPIKKVAESSTTISQMFSFVGVSLQKILIIQNETIALFLFLLSTIYLCYIIGKNYKNQKCNTSFIILCLTTYIPLLALIGGKTPSDAYMPMLFPGIIITVSILFQKIYTINRISKVLVIVFVTAAGFWNAHSLLSHNYYMQQKNGYGLTYATRESAANDILQLAKNKPFELKAVGPGSQFNSFSLNFTYITWYKTRQLSNSHNIQVITIYDDGEKYKISKK